MKYATIFFAAILLVTLCSMGYNKPDKIQRRKGIMNVNEKGKVTFTPLEDWKDYKPVNDTIYQMKVN